MGDIPVMWEIATASFSPTATDFPVARISE
jgi:hypothetical protein